MKTTNYLLLFVFAITLLSCKTEVKKELTETQDEVTVVEKTIYEKLGGAEGISGAVDQIVARHLENEDIKHYFLPLTENSEYFEQFKQHVKDFLGAGTGGGTEYTGRDMTGAHKGLNISEADFLSGIDDILFVLDANKVDRVSRNELLATLYSMKDAVIKQ
ncbi:group 1 truncated hemoglobin [Lutibacter sp.]|uniref:group I truncated hemoglobin n=1 Tax=Lutibacter sp. TaxID=1925666 RepID=UPI003566A98C